MPITPLQIALIVLIIVAVWAIVELATTIRSARKSMSDVAKNLNTTIEEVQQVVGKVDGLADDLNPTVKKLEPLVDNMSVSVEVLNQEMVQVDRILHNVSNVTGVASDVTSTVGKATEIASNVAYALIEKVGGPHKAQDPTHQLDASEQNVETAQKSEEKSDIDTSKKSYFTYPSKKKNNK